MAVHNDLGKEGEEIAVQYLIEKGYEILDRNWRYHKAEIDIIAQNQDHLIIVEVKTRSSVALGNPENFVDKKKINLLTQAADIYVNQQDIDKNIRFDIISIHKNGLKLDICHIMEAFLFF